MAITSFEEKISTRLTTLESRFEALIAQDRPGSKSFGVGRVPFGGATGILTDSANFTYDTANNRLAVPIVRLGGVTADITANTVVLAVNAIAAIGLNNFGCIFVHSGAGNFAMFSINGTANTTTELFDPVGLYSNTAGTASSINFYWSAGNARYEVENKRPGSVGIRIWQLNAT